MEQEKRKRGYIVKETDGRMNIYYGKEPWLEDIDGEECWTCNGIGYEGWDNIWPDTMPLSKEIRELKPGGGPIEVILAPVSAVNQESL